MVANRHAPVIKLPADATEDDHLALLGLLNSSTGCFWMKQTFHNKGSTVDQHGARQRTDAFEDFYEYTGTGLQRFPISASKPHALSLRLDQSAQRLACLSAERMIANWDGKTDLGQLLKDAEYDSVTAAAWR
jgi:hypothetical protein